MFDEQPRAWQPESYKHDWESEYGWVRPERSDTSLQRAVSPVPGT